MLDGMKRGSWGLSCPLDWRSRELFEFISSAQEHREERITPTADVGLSCTARKQEESWRREKRSVVGSLGSYFRDLWRWQELAWRLWAQQQRHYCITGGLWASRARVVKKVRRVRTRPSLPVHTIGRIEERPGILFTTPCLQPFQAGCPA